MRRYSSGIYPFSSSIFGGEDEQACRCSLMTAKDKGLLGPLSIGNRAVVHERRLPAQGRLETLESRQWQWSAQNGRSSVMNGGPQTSVKPTLEKGSSILADRPTPPAVGRCGSRLHRGCGGDYEDTDPLKCERNWDRSRRWPPCAGATPMGTVPIERLPQRRSSLYVPINLAMEGSLRCSTIIDRVADSPDRSDE